MTAMWFVLAAAGGAVARHQVNRLGTGWRGTMALNVLGAFALGLLVAAEPGQATVIVVGTGLLGSLTTFSTFALEFAEAPRRIRLVILVGTVVLGLAAAALGCSLG
ncbi:MAG: CrcB family protein [Ilumatobacteraceae bacterium]|nr:CrcB family protein [Ilumatobacteraceae bacterium]